MPSWKTLLVSLAVAAAGAWGVGRGTARGAAARQEMALLEAAGRAEGESFMKTLRGAHADRQLRAFDRRREVALDLARARRDQMLGGLALLASALIAGGGALARRVMREVAEGRSLVAGPPTDPRA
jgi:hypothetical protein